MLFLDADGVEYLPVFIFTHIQIRDFPNSQIIFLLLKTLYACYPKIDVNDISRHISIYLLYSVIFVNLNSH